MPTDLEITEAKTYQARCANPNDKAARLAHIGAWNRLGRVQGKDFGSSRCDWCGVWRYGRRHGELCGSCGEANKMDNEEKREQLFNRWKMLGFTVQNMASVVQNPINTLRPDDIIEWQERARKSAAQLKWLIEQTDKLLQERDTKTDEYD